ncbi:Transcription elongation factor SPT5 [Phytophthora palmivora]|uniref:Transcription elongation factor SPT5 n=1 Tax=Phytophthora palmivora TaxID=4796 RepID=A0A2P4X8U1_9STRA|nr:Transcription elongation factor SPT5 [Phytophthora palmivora]
MGTPQSSGRGGDAWNVGNDDALLETQMNQEKDITHATSFGTPLEPTAPSSDMSNSRYANPTTPMAPRSPTRDGMMPVTPAANPTTPGLNPTTPGLNPTTPGLQPRTPAYMMGHNPTTPGLNPTTPANLSAATPGMGHEPMGMEPMTPGFNPTTPGLSAMTPGLNPVTPGINTPGYNHNPMTPGFGVATPMGRMNSAVTPAATPGMMGGNGVPMTPAFNHDANDSTSGPAAGEVTWKMKCSLANTTVAVSGGSCSIDVDGRVITVSLSNVRPVVPEKQDTVIILSGDEAGTRGSLIGTDASDGIVKVDGGSEIKIYAIASLAKIAQ